MTYKIPLALLMFGVLSAQIPETLFEDGNKAISKIFGFINLLRFSFLDLLV